MSCGYTGMGRYARRAGVFGDVLSTSMGQCPQLVNRAVYQPGEIWQDDSYFSEQFVKEAATIYKAGGDTKLYQFRICVYNGIVAATTRYCENWWTAQAPVGTPPLCFDSQIKDRAVLSTRLAVLAQKGKAVATKVIASKTLMSTTSVKLTSPVIKTLGPGSTVTRLGGGAKEIPIIDIPEIGGGKGKTIATNVISLDEKEFGGYKYVAASVADAGGIIATLSTAGQSGTKVTGTKDFSGAHWSVINANITAESIDPALLLSGLVANGDGIIMTADDDSVYITGTKFIQKAAELCPIGQSEIFVLADPALGWQMPDVAPSDLPAATSDGTVPSNTMLYVGIGVGAVAVVGLVAYLAMRK